jgi:NAD(P)-dependent dehydrogenase (short-subunit alcohol dehydrogenase family)
MPDPIASHVLVTGSNRGLGLELVRQLAPRAERVYATCRKPEAAAALSALADAHADTIRMAPLDVADPSSIETVRALVERDTEALDLLINNAGINGGGRADRFGTVDAETMMRVLRVNTVGPHLLVQAFANLLVASTDPRLAKVVNLTSQLGSIANTGGGTWQSYKVSKAGLNMCTRLQAAELTDQGVIAVSMHPGWVQTDMGGPNARLTPQEAVAGMLAVIEDLTPDHAGRFLTYDGGELPW